MIASGACRARDHKGASNGSMPRVAKGAAEVIDAAGIDEEPTMANAVLDSHQLASENDGADRTLQLVSFRLAEEEYGIEISRVREIILVGEITEVPQTPPYVKGLINLRSTVIPIVDLKLRFGLPETEQTDDTRIVVVDVGGKTIGVIVDAVNEVLRISRDQIAPPPQAVQGNGGDDYVTGLAKVNDRLLILLDIEKLMFDEDQEEGVLASEPTES